MAKSQNEFNKQENEKKRLKKRKEKQERKEEQRLNSSGGGLDSMMAYVDEFGRITDTPPDPLKKKLEIDASTIEIGVPRRVEEVVSPFKNGRVDFFDDSKGFGFIKENGTQEKYFVHVNSCLDKIKEGDAVAFELEQGKKGINAVRVKKA